MGAHTKIAWCDHTFNPWIGCTKVSAGCANCYAERDDNRHHWTPEGWGKAKPRRLTSDSNWRQPIAWNKATEEQWRYHRSAPSATHYHRPRVFCASLADVFDPDVPPTWRPLLFDLIDATPSLDWLLCTKRPELWERLMMDAAGLSPLASKWRRGMVRPNIWLLVSVEDQATADLRIPQALRIPAVIHGVSYEPALGPVDFENVKFPRLGRADSLRDCNDNRLDWIIVGGESGPTARPFRVDWARSTIDQCRHAGVACFVKQLGSHPILDREDAQIIRQFKGDDPAEWPEDLRVREFPSPAVPA